MFFNLDDIEKCLRETLGNAEVDWLKVKLKEPEPPPRPLPRPPTPIFDNISNTYREWKYDFTKDKWSDEDDLFDEKANPGVF